MRNLTLTREQADALERMLVELLGADLPASHIEPRCMPECMCVAAGVWPGCETTELAVELRDTRDQVEMHLRDVLDALRRPRADRNAA